MRKITTNIPDKIEEKLRAIAKAEGRTLSSIVSVALEAYIRNYKPIK